MVRLSKFDTNEQKLCHKMQYLNTLQLSTFADEKKKLGDAFLMLSGEDIRHLAECQFIGARAIIFVLSGTVDLFINGNLHRLQADNYSDIFDGMLFRFGEVSPDAEAYCIFTTKSFMLDSLQGMIHEKDNYLFQVLSNPVMDFSGSPRAESFRMLLNMLSLSVADVSHKYRADMVRLYFKALVLEVSNFISSIDEDSMVFHKIGKRELLIASFVDLVWKHLTETREVSFYAKELCVTHKHLSRVVKEVTGKTPHEIIAGETLSMAVQLLQNNGLLVQQVADVLHFSDQAAFSKFFKKYFGLSPAEYRKKYYEDPSETE